MMSKYKHYSPRTNLYYGDCNNNLGSDHLRNWNFSLYNPNLHYEDKKIYVYAHHVATVMGKKMIGCNRNPPRVKEGDFY